LLLILFIEQNDSLLFEAASPERKTVQVRTLQLQTDQAAQQGHMSDQSAQGDKASCF
jgi:hypothetical protein